MSRLIEMELEYARIKKTYLDDATEYLRRIKDVCKSFDPSCRLVVFGSYVRGDMKVSSDVDVLVITSKARDSSYRGKLRVAIARNIGLVTPFEIHIITDEEYEKWYKKFMDVFREV